MGMMIMTVNLKQILQGKQKLPKNKNFLSIGKKKLVFIIIGNYNKKTDNPAQKITSKK